MSSNRHTPLPIPNGWFAVAWSKDLQPGDVKRVRAFDEELVLFRTRSGEPKVLDAYCAHLGAHLAEGGKVEGETIRCPFHAWRYDGDGNCVKIPYAKKIPPKAKLRAWEVVERNQMILVWRHAEEKPPFYEVPVLPEFSDPEWTEPRYFELEVAVHMQEMAENNCDPIHFRYVHGGYFPIESKISFDNDGLFMRMVSFHDREVPGGGSIRVALERDTWGLGVTSVRLRGIPGAGLLFLSATTPLDAGQSLSRWVFTVSKNMADVAGEEFIDSMSSGVLADMRIWENKIYRPRPVLCDGDEFLGDFRRWARQFYSDLEA